MAPRLLLAASRCSADGHCSASSHCNSQGVLIIIIVAVWLALAGVATLVLAAILRGGLVEDRARGYIADQGRLCPLSGRVPDLRGPMRSLS